LKNCFVIRHPETCSLSSNSSLSEAIAVATDAGAFEGCGKQKAAVAVAVAVADYGQVAMEKAIYAQSHSCTISRLVEQDCYGFGFRNGCQVMSNRNVLAP